MQDSNGKPSQAEIHNATVCFFVKQARTADDASWVYLAVKRDKVGKNFRNGYGGHIEKDETPRKCTAREVVVESGVMTEPEKLRYVALGEFTTIHNDERKTIFNVNFFIADEWAGEFADTSEMWGGRWYPIDKIPLDELMLADREWLGTILRDNVNFERRAQCYLIEAVYGPKQESLLKDVVLTPVHKLEID